MIDEDGILGLEVRSLPFVSPCINEIMLRRLAKTDAEEQPLTFSNVLVDAIDVLYNFHGLGWARSPESLLCRSKPTTLHPTPALPASREDRLARRSALCRAARPSDCV